MTSSPYFSILRCVDESSGRLWSGHGHDKESNQRCVAGSDSSHGEYGYSRAPQIEELCTPIALYLLFSFAYQFTFDRCAFYFEQ